MNEVNPVHPELGREVPVGAIDHELKKLWAEDDARTNASLINLAIYSEDPHSLESNSKAVRDLTVEHACRAILISMDFDAPEASIRAWITAHCHLHHGRKSVCCEQLAFALSGRAAGRLHNTVFSHLASDLPLTLWWQGELSWVFDDRFARGVDRFIFDSSEWSQPQDSFAKIQEALQARKALVVQDLEWTRSFQIRVSLAALFDDPVALAALPSMGKVVIRYQEDHRIGALQLLAWLVVQAGWKPAGEWAFGADRAHDSACSFAFESRGGHTLDVVLESVADGPPLQLLSLSGDAVTIEVSRQAGANYLCRHLAAPGHCLEEPGPLDPDECVGLVREQLSRGGKNSLYRKILPTFLELLKTVG
ncbi:glucose-6-phosphate dehydrogenase assembly protein OpcA [Haloferula luteola]|uniref:Glucose-6-phosphate dehydrogenase assembly protein OpcA n=1 Tax=Haloferula luteola TaxID=595692 RepID=A0A840VDG9_9BACT|nr:glucose-6-phosphate dehydrogenase assembly protein OpcA [Haloferula luteola]MBB5352678.1 glucose-6-phosphate dehydrogenase assembly protein OpcA [Haloferula luteola]